MKNQKGITLIALVITIVVLIILAGVSISLVVGADGLLNKAKEGKENMQEAQNEETIILDQYSNIVLDSITDKDKELEDLKPYEGKGYVFIYDGSLGESGSTGANTCSELTGGWQPSTFDWRADGDAGDWNFTNPTITYNTNYVRFYMYGNTKCGSAYSINSINYSEYDEVLMKINLFKKSGSLAYPGFCNDKTIKDTLGGYYYFNPNGWNYGSASTYSGWSSIKLDTLSYTPNYAFVGVYVDAGNEAYCDIYEYILVKDDNWKDWIKMVDLNVEDFTDLNSVITNSSAMNKLMENEKAVRYMLKCSGTLMTSIIQNDTAWSYITQNVKTQIMQNADWQKFVTIYNRV